LTRADLIARFRQVVATHLPLPGGGETAERHRRLYEFGREDLSLARLAEAHFDAVAILSEAGRSPRPGVLYGVWAAEAPAQSMSLHEGNLNGSKPFCSGAGIVDHALVTVNLPEEMLVDIDLRDFADPTISFDTSGWKATAFAHTRTAQANFDRHPVSPADILGPAGFYLRRPGFWHGACGPAACWAGGAAGLLDWAGEQKRDDPHTLAHLGAIHAAVWSMRASLEAAGREIDADPAGSAAAMRRALTLRHLVEQGSTDILRRLARAFGPHPLAFNENIAQRYQELDLYLRQSHAERDLEALGRALRSAHAT
jgi:hypothetical protein